MSDQIVDRSKLPEITGVTIHFKNGAVVYMPPEHIRDLEIHLEPDGFENKIVIDMTLVSSRIDFKQ